MASGVLIRSSAAPDHPGFWFPCKKAEAAAAVRSWYAHWGREQVVANGVAVTRDVPPDALTATFCTKFDEKDGEPSLENPEALNVAAILKG